MFEIETAKIDIAQGRAGRCQVVRAGHAQRPWKAAERWSEKGRYPTELDSLHHKILVALENSDAANLDQTICRRD